MFAGRPKWSAIEINSMTRGAGSDRNVFAVFDCHALLDDGWEGLVWVIVVYSVLNVTIQTFIQPRFVGNSVGLSAEMTYMSLVVWAFLLGPVGALLAVPMTLLLRAFFIDADPRAAWAAPLIDAQVDYPDTDPEPDPRHDPDPEETGTTDRAAVP